MKSSCPSLWLEDFMMLPIVFLFYFLSYYCSLAACCSLTMTMTICLFVYDDVVDDDGAIHTTFSWAVSRIPNNVCGFKDFSFFLFFFFFFVVFVQLFCFFFSFVFCFCKATKQNMQFHL